MGCGCCSCGECMIFLSGSPGKSGSSSVDDFPDTLIDVLISFRKLWECSDEHDVTGNVHNS